MPTIHFPSVKRFVGFIAALAGFSFCGCASLPKTPVNAATSPPAAENPSVSLALSPASGIVETSQALSFTSPFGPFPVQWSVNGVVGGNSSVGTVDKVGVYTAPLVPLTNSVTLSASLPDANQNPAALSAAALIRIVNPIPVVTQVSPSAIPVGTSPAPITVVGTGFNPTSNVFLNDLPASVSFVDPTRLVVNVPAPVVSSAGTWTITVSNGIPGGGTSSAQPISIQNPVPVLTQVSPNSILAGSPDLTVGLTGSEFVASSQVLINGQPTSSSFIDAGQLSAVIPSSVLAQCGYLSVSVSNIAPGGGSSSTLTFAALNPQPTVNSISPSALFMGVAPNTLTISGNNFVPNSQVSFQGQTLNPVFVNSNELQLSVPNLSLSPGNAPITVTNPAPGGGSSLRQFAVISGAVTNTGNPQVARYNATIPGGSSVWVEFGQQDYRLSTSASNAPAGGGQAGVFVAGMKPSSEYHLRPAVKLEDGTTIYGPDQTFTTGSLSAEQAPPLVISNNALTESGNGVELYDFVSQANPDQLMIAVSDMSGNIIWYYQPEIPGDYALPIRQLSDGNFLVSLATAGGTSGISKVVREIDLAGETIKQVTLDQVNTVLNLNLFAFHHETIALPNGHWILLAQEYKPYADLPGFPGVTEVLGDVLIDVDQNMNPVWSWSTFDHLDVNRHPMGFPDWTHSNALAYDEVDGSLLLSMRHQSWVLKIDYENGMGDGHVVWRLGPGGDFELNGGDPTQWFYAQHYPNIVSKDVDGFTLALMDNGNIRPINTKGDLCNVAPQPCYSRAILMYVDEKRMTANVRWSFEPGFFSIFGGNVDLLPNGDLEADFASEGSINASAIYEVNPSGSIVWQVNTPNSHAYRAVRIPSLYSGVQW